MPASTSHRVVTLGVFVAAIASLSVVAVAFVRYPAVVSGAGTWLAVGIFAAVLTTYVVVAVNAGPRLVETRLTVASAVAGALIAASWLGIGVNTTVGGSAAVMVALLVLGLLVGLALGWLATTRSGSSDVGLACVALTALTAGFALFLVWAGWAVATGGRPYDAGLLRDFTSSGVADLATYAVNDSLGTAMILLLLVPLLSATTGLAGAAAARIKGSRRPI